MGVGASRVYYLQNRNNGDPFFQEPPEDPDLDVDRYFRDKDLEDLTLKTYDSLGLDVRSMMWRAATSMRGPARTSMPSASRSVGSTRTTCGCSPMSDRTLTG
jgi:hypothetical protein